MLRDVKETGIEVEWWGVQGAGGVEQSAESSATKKGKAVRALRWSEGDEARGLILSSRTESLDSKRIFTL